MMQPRLIAITIVRNESGNYLRPWLKNIGSIADYHIFLDDGSDDDTPETIARHLEKHPGELHRRKTSLFCKNEPALRAQLWDYVRSAARDGDWVLIVDADEFYDERMLRLKKRLLRGEHPGIEVVKVSCLDMWNSTCYRTDGYWSPRKSDTRIIRYHDVPFDANGKDLHQPPYPASTDISRNLSVWIPKVHTAYLREADKRRRYEFYTANVSPDRDSVSYRHALSIADGAIQSKPFITAKQTLLAILLWRRRYLQIRKVLKKYGEKQ